MHKRLASEFARIEQKYPNPMNKHEIILAHALAGEYLGNNFRSIKQTKASLYESIAWLCS